MATESFSPDEVMGLPVITSNRLQAAALPSRVTWLLMVENDPLQVATRLWMQSATALTFPCRAFGPSYWNTMEQEKCGISLTRYFLVRCPAKSCKRGVFALAQAYEASARGILT